eukprot:31198-Pelagococcus_subviridis.AAC.40
MPSGSLGDSAPGPPCVVASEPRSCRGAGASRGARAAVCDTGRFRETVCDDGRLVCRGAATAEDDGRGAGCDARSTFDKSRVPPWLFDGGGAGFEADFGAGGGGGSAPASSASSSGARGGGKSTSDTLLPAFTHACSHSTVTT